MSEQLEFNAPELYPTSHWLGYNYIEERNRIYDSKYIEIDDLHLCGNNLKHFRENFEYLYEKLKKQIEKYLNENPEYELNFINLHEYPYNSGCDAYNCPNTLYKLEIQYIRYETEDEFINRKEKEKLKVKKNLDEKINDIKNQLSKLSEDEREEFLKKVNNDE